MAEAPDIHSSIGRVHALEPTVPPTSTEGIREVSRAERSLTSPPEVPCANCGADRAGAFCYVCGQRYRDERLTVRRVLRDLTARFLDLESGLLYTLYRLTVAPGTVARDYVAGQRRRYVRPATYLIVITTLLILTFSMVKADYVRFIEATWLPALPDQLFRLDEGVIQSDEFAATLTRWLSQGSLYLSLFMAGAFAVLVRWIHPRWRQRYNVAETWVFAIYASAHAFLLSLPLYGLVFLDGVDLVIRFTMLGASLIVGMTVYMAIAARQFMDGRWSTALIAGGVYLATTMASSWISAGIGLALAVFVSGG